MGDNGRRARAYPVHEPGARIVAPRGTESWFQRHGRKCMWHRDENTKTIMRGEIVRIVAASNTMLNPRPRLLVVRCDDGAERGLDASMCKLEGGPLAAEIEAEAVRQRHSKSGSVRCPICAPLRCSKADA